MTSPAGRARRAAHGAPRPSRPAARAGRGPRDPGRSESTTTRSASSSASSTSCVTSTTARPWPARSRPASQAFMRRRVIASSAPNGSSRSSTGRPGRQVRSSARRWRMPPDSSCGHARSNPASPNSSNSARARGLGDRAGRCPAIRAPTSAFGSARRHGSSPSRWGIHAAAGRRRPVAPVDRRAGRRQARRGRAAASTCRSRTARRRRRTRRRATSQVDVLERDEVAGERARSARRPRSAGTDVVGALSRQGGSHRSTPRRCRTPRRRGRGPAGTRRSRPRPSPPGRPSAPGRRCSGARATAR